MFRKFSNIAHVINHTPYYKHCNVNVNVISYYALELRKEEKLGRVTWSLEAVTVRVCLEV